MNRRLFVVAMVPVPQIASHRTRMLRERHLRKSEDQFYIRDLGRSLRYRAGWSALLAGLCH